MHIQDSQKITTDVKLIQSNFASMQSYALTASEENRSGNFLNNEPIVPHELCAMGTKPVQRGSLDGFYVGQGIMHGIPIMR